MVMLGKIDTFLRHSGMPETHFGRRVANDPRLVADMRRGRQPGPRMRARIEAFIAAELAQWPESHSNGGRKRGGGGASGAPAIARQMSL